MKRKLLSLLLCAAMFIGVLPAVSFADSTTSAGAKLGVENGDIVRYAGKDGSPIKWRVIDSATTNTGNTNGMLLLSENTLYDVTSTSTSVGWLDSDCNNFYNTYFSDAYKEAVMTVSKTDSNYTYNSNVYEGRLSGAAVFVLSAKELEDLPASLKKFSGSSNWWLRSMCPKGAIISTFSYYSFANAETGKFAALLTSANKNTVKLRPAVNLNKNKLAKIGDKLLLLPTDESANEWELSLKNDISMTAYTAYDTELNINTNSMADCISVVIVKNDGSISYYKKYEQTALNQTIPVTLPSDTDAKTDSMYVFAEKTGSVSDPVKVCISHNFAYTALGDSAHSAKCSDCGYEVTQSHNFGEYTVTDQGHEQTCSVCGFVKAENHKFGSYTITEQGHEQTCSVCNFVKTENHTLTYTSNDSKTHNAACVCGYTEKNLEHIYNTKIGETAESFTCSDCGAAHFTALNGMFGDKALREEYEAYTGAINGEISPAANRIFTDDDTSVSTATDCTGTLALTFKTKRPVRATGFQIKLYGTLPKTISLYGKNSENNYEEIGTAALRSIIDDKPNGKTYSFVFSAKSDFNAYDSFKTEMNFNPGDWADIAYFGLISEKAIAAANLNLTGIMAADAPDLMYSGEDYIASFISGNGYPKANNFSIFEDNKMFGTDYWEYSADTGIMKIFNQYIKENSIYEINGFCNDKVTVKFNSQTLTLTNNDREALFGQEYVAEFSVISGKQELAPTSLNDITVINKNGDITHLCTLDSEGKLHIPGELLIGGVGDSIKISAEEAGKTLPQEQAAVKVTKNGDDRYFANMDDAKAVIESDGETDITLLKDTDSGVTVTLSGKKTNIDLGGNTLTAKSDSEIFNIQNGAQVSISNGAFTSDSAETVIYTDSNGVLTLNNVTTPQSEKSVYVSYPSKLILDGANSDAAVYLQDGTFEQKNGTSRLSSDLSIINNIKLYGGRVATYNIGQVNMFSLIDDGYSFELSDSAMFDDFVRSISLGLSFSVKNGSVITEQPQDITAELGEGASLTVGAAEGSSYYWFDPDDCAKCKSNKNYLEIGADTPVGKYSYLCAVLNGNTVSGSRIVTVTVTCSHKSVTNGICDGCGIKIAAQATVNGKTQTFENINDAVAFANANENTVIQLSVNVTIDDYVSFSGKNTTLDMNGKTFASSNTNRFITVNGDNSLTVIGNGEMTARLLAEDNSTLNIENGEFEEVSAGNNSALTVNGGIFKMLNASGGTVTVNDGKITMLNARSTTVLNGGIFDEISGSDFYTLLPEGKAFVGATDGKFNTAEYEYYKGSDGIIKNVTIADAPFAITKQPKGGFIAEGTKDAVVSVGIEKNEAYKGEITYNWISGTMSYDDEFTVENENAGAAAAVIINTNGLGGGVQKTYQCTVSYEGYVLSTDYATFTIGKGKPVVDFEEGYINSCGNDCLLIVAVYNGSELLATHTKALSKDETFMDIDTVLSPLFEKIGEDESIDKIKIFFWDSLGNMKPIRNAAEPSAF